MADGLVQVAPDSTGKKVDTSELTVGANTVERQRMVVSDDATAAAVAKVTNGAPGGSDYGLVSRALLYDANGVAIAQKAASTLPAATDPALVVSLSPNSASAAPVSSAFALTNGGSWLVPINGADNVLTLSVPVASTFIGTLTVFAVLGTDTTSPDYALLFENTAAGVTADHRVDSNHVSSTWNLAGNTDKRIVRVFPGARYVLIKNTLFTSGTGTLTATLTQTSSNRSWQIIAGVTSGGQPATTTVSGSGVKPGSTDPALVVSLSPNTNVVPVILRTSLLNVTFSGRAPTFRTPGRAGTTGQKIFALHNAAGSAKIVTVNSISVDLLQTVIKAVTVLPPVIRVHRFTAIPTSGTSLTKNPKDSALATDASVTVWGDASADGTSSGTALTITIPATSMLAQEFAPRLITAAGYEMFDRTTFFGETQIVLRALEGVVVFLDYTLATSNPTTDMWVVTCDWDEA